MNVFERDRVWDRWWHQCCSVSIHTDWSQFQWFWKASVAGTWSMHVGSVDGCHVYNWMFVTTWTKTNTTAYHCLPLSAPAHRLQYIHLQFRLSSRHVAAMGIWWWTSIFVFINNNSYKNYSLTKCNIYKLFVLGRQVVALYCLQGFSWTFLKIIR